MEKNIKNRRASIIKKDRIVLVKKFKLMRAAILKYVKFIKAEKIKFP